MYKVAMTLHKPSMIRWICVNRLKERNENVQLRKLL